MRRLLAAARRHSQKAHVLLALCYNGAFRVCEALHLKVDDFNLEEGLVRTIPARRARATNVTVDGRTVALARPLPDPVVYPLPFNVVHLASQWIKDQSLVSGNWLFCGNTKSCAVIEYKCLGGHMAKREAQRIYQRAAQAAGLNRNGRGIHSLKHGRLLELAEKTMDPWFVKAAGRMRSVVTADVYVRHARMRKTMSQIGGIV